MKPARLSAIVALLSLSLACSGGSTPDATPTPVAAVSGAAATAKASGTPRVGNAAPQVHAITFVPPQADGYPAVTDKITASAATNDPDGDGVTVEWKWFHNGAELTGQLGDTLAPSGRWKKHDKIEVEATPKDTRGAIGTPLKASIKFRNSTPEITSKPSGSLNGYRAVVKDADSTDATERFKWTLEAPVPGFTLSDDGTLRFDAVAGKGSSGQKVTIVVTDSAGAFSKQTFDVKF